jgi:hypothetical protein
MPNDTDSRVTPLKTRDTGADGSLEDVEWTEAATDALRAKSVFARVLGFRLLWAALALAAVLLLFLMYHRSTSFELQNAPRLMAQKLETLSTLRISFLKSIEAEKLAVMAESDEASLAFADESRRASEAVAADLQELSRLIGLQPATDESRLLQEFEAVWGQVRKIDRVILDLAVQNTNLKAFRLSFGKGREAVERFENALNAPHIASPDDAEMNRIEQVIHAKEKMVRRSLESLVRLAPAGKQANVNEAIAAHRDFMAVTDAVIEWSRQNTNVSSLNISLNRKQKATALCEAVLNQLHEAFEQRAFKATR